MASYFGLSMQINIRGHRLTEPVSIQGFYLEAALGKGGIGSTDDEWALNGSFLPAERAGRAGSGNLHS